MLLLFWSHISDNTQYRHYKVLIATIQNVIAKRLITLYKILYVIIILVMYQRQHTISSL